MQYKVPQNIDLADRIVGPLTLVQFLYVLSGGMVVYLLFSTIAPTNPVLFFFLALPITVLTLALAFLKIQDQPFPKFVRSFIIFLFRPKVRIWHRSGEDPELIVAPDKHPKQLLTRQPKVIKKSELDKLIQVLDTSGSVGGAKEHEVAMRQAVAGHVDPAARVPAKIPAAQHRPKPQKRFHG